MLKSKRNTTRIGGGYALSEKSNRRPVRTGGFFGYAQNDKKAVGMTRRVWLSLILSFICAILMCCAFIAPKFANAQTTADTNDTTKTLKIDELTLSGYDSSKDNAQVFNGNNLFKLYGALTGATNGSATIDKVEELISTTSTKTYVSGGYSIPDYLNASEIKAINGKNIVVTLGGFDWDVVFLTRDTSGHLIMTLWMDQPLGGSSNPNLYKFGWANAAYNETIGPSDSTRIANAYGTSELRALGLNGGPTSGASSYYTSRTASTTVSAADRQSHLLANFTLDNASTGNKSLTQWLVQPKNVEYMSYLSYTYIDGVSATSHLLNDAYTGNTCTNIKDTAGKTNTTFYGSASNGTHNGGWWNQGVRNYATSSASANGYNDWGDDYVWAPSLPETGYQGGANEGLWNTRVTGQNKFGTGATGAPSSAPNASTAISARQQYSWLRSGTGGDAYYSSFLSSSGGFSTAFTAASLAVRPALHFNLTAADEAKTLTKPTASLTSSYSYDGNAHTYMPVNFNADTMQITDNVQTDAGQYTATVTPKAGYIWTDGSTDEVKFTFKINKATPTVTPVFSGDRPYNTAGFPEPASYTAGANGIEITGKFSWINQQIEVDKSKEYEWTFTPDDEFINNFEVVKGKQTFNFQERKIVSMTAKFDSNGATVYTKTSTGDLMKMITLTVTYNDGEVVNETNFEISCSLHEGTGNSITVMFGGQLPQIVPVEDYVVKAEVEDLIVVYSQGGNKITPNTPLEDLKQYITVYPKWNYTSTSEPLTADEYTLTGTLTVGSPEIKVVYEGFEKVISPAPTVVKDRYNFSVEFADKLVAYTGEKYDPAGWIDENALPSGVTVEYVCATDMTSVGKHTVTARFSGDYDNYETIPDKTATLTIENNYALPEFAESTLYYNADGVTFKLLNFDGIKEIAVLTSNGVTVTLENALNKTDIGDYELTITLKDGKFLGDKESVTLYYSVVKCKVEVPAYIAGSLVYSGNSLTAKAENFEFDSAIVGFVSAESGVNAGSYTAVFELLDTEHYEWYENTVRKVAAKYSLTDETELLENRIQVPWSIAKATVTATVEEGKMPVFSCATVGDLSGYVSYTYYKDELCTEQIAFGELLPATRYYVKATFTDESGNFELDDSATAVLNGKAKAYDTAAKEPTFIQKAFAYIKEHWLWFAIGGAALLLLILLIIIIAVASKKRKQKAEERKAEKKEEERQRRAEEREERMLRMQNMQSMPITAAGMIAAQQAQQVQPAPVSVPTPAPAPVQQEQPVQQYAQQQAMPTAMPAPVQQPAADTYALEARLRAAEERARYAEERIARDAEERARQAEERTLRAAEERARLAEEQLMRNAYMNRVTPAAGNDNGNISLDALGALVLAALKNYAGGEKPEQIAPAEQPQLIEAGSTTANVPAVYPPDAVITTTTTVDTTQKPLRRDKEVNSSFSDLDGFYDNYIEK